MSDILITKEKDLLQCQLKILDILEPLSDEQRIRVVRALHGYCLPITLDDLAAVNRRRAGMSVDGSNE